VYKAFVDTETMPFLDGVLAVVKEIPYSASGGYITPLPDWIPEVKLVYRYDHYQITFDTTEDLRQLVEENGKKTRLLLRADPEGWAKIIASWQQIGQLFDRRWFSQELAIAYDLDRNAHQPSLVRGKLVFYATRLGLSKSSFPHSLFRVFVSQSTLSISKEVLIEDVSSGMKKQFRSPE